MTIETDTPFHQSGQSTTKERKYHVDYSAEVCVHNKSIGWRMKEYIEAIPFVGAKSTGTELLWKVVTPAHCCIKLSWIADKTWIKYGIFHPIFQLANSDNILDNSQSFTMGTKRYLKGLVQL